VNCVQTGRVDELLSKACRGDYQLIVVDPDHLVPEPTRKAAKIKIEEVVRVIREIKRQHTVPVIAVAAGAEHESELLALGVESVLGLPFNAEALRLEVRRLLRMRERVEATEPARASSVGLLFRAFNFKAVLQTWSDNH